MRRDGVRPHYCCNLPLIHTASALEMRTDADAQFGSARRMPTNRAFNTLWVIQADCLTVQLLDRTGEVPHIWPAGPSVRLTRLHPVRINRTCLELWLRSARVQIHCVCWASCFHEHARPVQHGSNSGSRTSSGIQLPSKWRLMAVPHRSLQVPLPAITVRRRLGAGATRSVSESPAASARVFCAPCLSVCGPAHGQSSRT